MTSEIAATEQFISNTNNRIEAMKAELTNVGILGRAYQWLMSIMAQRQLAYADELDNYANGKINRDQYGTDVGAAGQIPDDWKPNESQIEQAQQESALARASGTKLMEQSGQAGIDYLQGQVVLAQKTINDNRAEVSRVREQIYLLGQDGSKKSGTLDPDDEKKKTPRGSNSGSPSASTKPQRDALKMQQEADFYKLKIASDAYASSLDNLKTLEDIYGKTVASSNEELDLILS